MSTFGMESPFERITRDFERQLAQFRALTQPPWTRMLDELSREHLVVSRTLDLAAHYHIRELNALSTQLQQQFQHVDAIVRSFSPDLTRLFPAIEVARHTSFTFAPEFVRTLNIAWESNFKSHAELLRIRESSIAAALPMLRAFDAAIANALSSDERLRLQLERSFGAQLFRHIAEIEEYADDEEAVTDRLRQLVATFLAKCASLARDPTHAWGMFQTLLTLIVVLYGILSDRAMENRLSGHISQVEKGSTDAIADAVRQMRTAIEQLHPAEGNIVQYVVLREARLKRRPSPKSPSIRTLYPHEITELIDAKGIWIHVKVFDYVNGTSDTGWVLKKYLKRFGSPPPRRPHSTP